MSGDERDAHGDETATYAMRRHISKGEFLNVGFVGKVGTPLRQGTKGTLRRMGDNGAQSFYRRDELSAGMRSDPKSVRFLRSVFSSGETVALLSGTALFFPVCFPLAWS